MRKVLTLLWLLFPVGVIAFHYDRGPRQIQREKAYAMLQEIRREEKRKEKDWEEILTNYHTLVTLLPRNEDPMVLYQIRLAKAKARLEALELATAIDELEALLDEVADKYGDDAKITRAVREALGKAYYMAAWTLKTVFAPEKEWLPYSDRARMIFRYLAEHEDPKSFHAYEKRVENTVQKMSNRLK